MVKKMQILDEVSQKLVKATYRYKLSRNYHSNRPWQYGTKTDIDQFIFIKCQG